MFIVVQVCSLRTERLCGLGCGVTTGNISNLSETGSAAAGNVGLACLQALADEENFDELQYQLYIKEIQRLNPSLREGCMFVDGLYELVCSRLPVQVGAKGDTNLTNSARDFITVHTTDKLLLQKYWHKPHDSDEYTAYLTIATSFVNYIITKYGPQGVSMFLQQLDYTIDDPLAENFRFKGQDILKLEFKWKKYVEAEVNTKFRLSVLGMLHILFTHYLLTYTPQVIIVLILILADVALEFLYSIAFAELISLGFSPGTLDKQLLFQWVSVLIITLLVRFVVLLSSAGILVGVAVGVGNQIRKSISARFKKVTPLYLADHSSCSLLTTFSQDINTLEKVISTAVRAIAVAMVLVVACFIYSAIIVWPLAIYLAVLFLLSQFLNNIVSVKLSISLFAKAQANGKLCEILKEQIDGFFVSRIYRLAGLWSGQMEETIRRSYTSQARKALFFTNFCWFFQQMVPNVSIATMLFGIIILSREGYTDFTSGVSVFLFYIRVSVGLTAAASMFPELQTASTAMGRINALLNNRQHEIHQEGEGESDSDSQNSSINRRSFESPPPEGTVLSLPIEFKGVCFSYKMSAAHWNLYNVSLDIKKGERVVIVGTSGSGKSTLLTLAMHLYKPTVGDVIIGGGKSPFYRGVPKISVTFQNNHMFNMTLRENIRLGNLAASNDEVEEAAKKADIHDWIMTLARGYDTTVQSGGSSLSGGQRQRIAIARMLIAKSPICLLDEVTSALDPVTETRVFTKLMEVTRGQTVLAITHKLEQAKHFDRIVVLSHGRVKEVGSHSGLLAHRGVYWRMCNNDMTVSPGRPVPIPRRRSSGALQIEETPLLQPQPMTFEPYFSDPHENVLYPTPKFYPLETLIETRESCSSHHVPSYTTQVVDNNHTPSPMTAWVTPAIITAPTNTADDDILITNDVTPTINYITEHCSTGEQSYNNNMPRQASTPLIHTNHPIVREVGLSVEVTNDALEETENSYTTAPSVPLLTVPEIRIEPPSSSDSVNVGKEKNLISRSMDDARDKWCDRISSNPRIGQTFDANQTMPTHLVDVQSVTGLRRHPMLKFHSSSTGEGQQRGGEEPLRLQLEKVLKNDTSLASLASFFDIELVELLEHAQKV